MIRDRGTMKWTAMMLPEHVKLLRDWAKEDEYEKVREMDEQHLQVMDETISEAIEFEKSLTVTHYRQQKYELVIGHIHTFDQIDGKLHIVDRFGEVHKIPLAAIADVRLTDDS